MFNSKTIVGKFKHKMLAHNFYLPTSQNDSKANKCTSQK